MSLQACATQTWDSSNISPPNRCAQWRRSASYCFWRWRQPLCRSSCTAASVRWPARKEGGAFCLFFHASHCCVRSRDSKRRADAFLADLMGAPETAYFQFNLSQPTAQMEFWPIITQVHVFGGPHTKRAEYACVIRGDCACDSSIARTWDFQTDCSDAACPRASRLAPPLRRTAILRGGTWEAPSCTTNFVF